jgi:hypothetical protein
MRQTGVVHWQRVAFETLVFRRRAIQANKREERQMLTIGGGGANGGQRFCDGVSRRDFLKIGGLAMGGFALTDILAAEARAGVRASHKAIIMIYLPGGPPHQDMFDLKIDAPSEIRGEFKPIKTKVPGIEICEHMPRIAAMMDKFAIIRSLVGARDEHDASVCLSGYSAAELNQNHAPCLGSVVSYLNGPVEKTVPAFVGLSPKMGHPEWALSGDPGFLGLAHSPLKPEGPLMADMTLNGITLDRLRDRRQLLASLDRFRQKVDTLEGMDALHRRAFDLLTSHKLVEALDISKEDPKVRARYGKGSDKPVDDGGPLLNEQFLAARRLVEAGARCVTIGYGRWDYHNDNFGQLKRYLPMLDQGVSALVQDIHDRGMDKDVSVVVWGEFGRSPRINKDAGRDHWPRVSCALLAGGGMKTGQVIGSTNRFGEEPDSRPVQYKDVFATLYHNMGISIKDTPVMDTVNRPHYLLPDNEPIAELI